MEFYDNQEDLQPTASAILLGRNSGELRITWDKLVRLEWQYDQKRCSNCGKASAVDNLKTCGKCGIAKYCSRECQVADWPKKHKEHCKEMNRLKEILEPEQPQRSSASTQAAHHRRLPLRVTVDASPWLQERDLEIWNIAVYQTWVIVMGYSIRTGSRAVNKYNSQTGAKEGIICQRNADDKIFAMITVNLAGELCLAISYAEGEYQPWLIDFWSIIALK